MDIQLLKQLGNIDQIAGIREARLLHGRGEGMEIAEFYNAAGLRFTVLPDRNLDLMELSYKGMNFAFQSKNGPVNGLSFRSEDGEFCDQWPAGMLVTCGLDNVGGELHADANYPTHGRISSTPAKHFGVQTEWQGGDYILRAHGETHQSKLFGSHICVERTIETGLFDKKLRLHDKLTNLEAEDAPYMLLYHINFGYPIVRSDSLVKISKHVKHHIAPLCDDHEHLSEPIDGRDEELYLFTDLGDNACGVIYNEKLELGAYVAYDTKNLPNMLEWKRMKSHDYVVAIEPCNTFCIDRQTAIRENKIAVLPAYTSVENDVEIGILDGLSEIRSFIAQL